MDKKPKILTITWLNKCPKCERKEHNVTTTEGTEKWLYEDDKVECWCGQTGLIETDGVGHAWVEWDDLQRTSKDNFNDYYREKFPENWEMLPKANHYACTHYYDLLNAWLVSEHGLKENYIFVPKGTASDVLNKEQNHAN